MDIIQTSIMGLVQGLSEFLPVSSSAHIVIASSLYKLFTGSQMSFGVDEEIFFDILLHLATLLAILIFFRDDIIKILKAFFLGIFDKKQQKTEFFTSIFIIFATFFTGIIAIFIKDFAHSLVQNPVIVSMLLIVTGIILYLSETFKPKKEKPLDLKASILIGIAQGLAVFPGLSRSGLTISCGIFQGIKREEAAKFSFLLSAPIILLASAVYPLIELDIEQISTFNIKAMLIGAILAFVSGYICIKYFMQFLKKYNLKCFAYYCIIMGIGLTAVFALSYRL